MAYLPRISLITEKINKYIELQLLLYTTDICSEYKIERIDNYTLRAYTSRNINNILSKYDTYV